MDRHYFIARHGCAQHGATLVEALVAALVLAIGILGTAVLFLHGLQANRSALLRSEAVRLTAELGERIRANRQGRSAYAAAGGPTATDAARRAALDLAEWHLLIAARLPAPADGGAAALVQFLPGASAARPDRYRIRIAWSEPGRNTIWNQQQVLDLLPVAGS
jgi:type IV pilus modification protein PilV